MTSRLYDFVTAPFREPDFDSFSRTLNRKCFYQLVDNLKRKFPSVTIGVFWVEVGNTLTVEHDGKIVNYCSEDKNAATKGDVERWLVALIKRDFFDEPITKQKR